MIVFLVLYLLSHNALTAATADIAKQDIVIIDQAVQLYRIQHRGVCTADLEALTRASKAKLETNDPWGTTYRFSCPGTAGVWVRSAGPDTTFGTDDDLDNRA